MGYNAVLLGATGLVGSSVLQELIEDERCQNVALLTRKSLGTLSPKVHEILVDLMAFGGGVNFLYLALV